jgi:hypothetical protein
LIENETGSWISIDGFWGWLGTWAFRGINRSGDTQNQFGDIFTDPQGESYEVTRMYVCVLAVGS